MYRCILCGEIIEGGCGNCGIDYEYNFPQNTPFFNQLFFLIEKNQKELAIEAVHNFIQEIEITTEIMKTDIPLIQSIEFEIITVKSIMQKIMDLLERIKHKLENDTLNSDGQLLIELRKMDSEILNLQEKLNELQNKVRNIKFVRNELKKSGIELDYIREKMSKYYNEER